MYESKFDINFLNEENFKNFLDTANFPAPDLIIRTGGDIRHSGFTLYDSTYSEYYFTEKFWPEFDEEELDKALDFFYKRERRF
jgi:undecaprenyl diphosphate synthase